MKKMLLAIAIVSTGILFSCKSGGGDPKTVLSNFYEALGKNDFAGAQKYATTESKTMLDALASFGNLGDKEAKKDEKNEQFDKANMEMGEPKIEGDKATIDVKNKKTGEVDKAVLKKQGGEWKVAFDKETVKEMQAEKMKTKMGDFKDSLSNGLEDLKDSLSTEVDKGLKDAETKMKEEQDKKN